MPAARKTPAEIPSDEPVKGKVSARRLGAESSKTRTALLDAAEQLMLDEGYAAVTSRKLADKAGLKRQLVHYYFRTMDDLFVTLWRRHADKTVARQAQALASTQPMRGLWDHASDAYDTALGVEFMALAHHRKAIQAELNRTGERLRSMQIGVLSQVMGDYDLGDVFGSPESLALLLVSVPRILVMEAENGIAGGHAKLREQVESWLTRVEGARAEPATADSQRNATAG